MTETRRSVQGRRLYDLDALCDRGEEGDFFVDDEGGAIWIYLPGSDPRAPISRWPWREPMLNYQGKTCKWAYNGNPDHPTLRPSLHLVGVWHGFLENGFLRSC